MKQPIKNIINEESEIPISIRRRIRLIDNVINNTIINMLDPCIYNSVDEFINGILNEIGWYLIDVEELSGIDRVDIKNYILNHKYDTLTNYFNARCSGLKNDNLQESIRRILKEEDFIPLEDLNTVIKDYDDGFNVFIMNGDRKIGEISFTKEDQPNQYTIIDATIDDEYKGNRIYPKTIIKLFNERPNLIINSVFRSPEAEKAWIYILNNLPPNIGKSVKHYKEENTTLIQLKLRNLQESIRRILREETLDEKIKDVILNGTDFDDWIKAVKLQYGDIVPLYHATTKENSKIIDKEGFKLVDGKNYKSWGKEPILYFQIGKSDYQAKNRPVLYRLDVPVDFLYNAEIDMDGPNISEETLFKYVDEETWEDLPYEIKDVITYFIWNNLKLDGMEIFVTNRFLDDPDTDIFKDLKPIKVNTL